MQRIRHKRLSQPLICVAKFLKEFNRKQRKEKCVQYCPSECEWMSLHIASYTETIPSTGNISALSRNEQNFRKFQTYEEINKHFVSVYIYYTDLRYTFV